MSARDAYSQVAESVPFDNSGQSYYASELQNALVELRRNNVCEHDTTTTTLNGTLTLTATDKSCRILEGTATGYSIQLPNATGLFEGRKFEVYNSSTQPILVKDGVGTTLFTLGQSSIGYITLHSNLTAAGSWYFWQVYVSSTASGIINYNVVNSTPFSTTSTSYVQIAGFSITPQAGTYAVWYSAQSFLNTTPKTHWWSIYKAGVQIANSERSQDTAHSDQTMNDSTQTIVTVDGTESIDVRVKTENGTLKIEGRSLLLIRLGT